MAGSTPDASAMAAEEATSGAIFPAQPTRYDGRQLGSRRQSLSARGSQEQAEGTDAPGNRVAAASEEAKRDRVTLRLPARELERLRELARQRHTDVASLAREAIATYLEGTRPREDLERLERALKEAMRLEASRVIDRHDATTRALIDALNAHLTGRPAGKP